MLLCMALVACRADDPNKDGQEEKKQSIGVLGQPNKTSAPLPNGADDSAPQSSEPNVATAQPTLRPTPKPTAEPIKTEEYSCNDFTMTIPKGWNVSYFTLADAMQSMQLYVFVTDPQDENNQLIFCGTLEPFFTSQQQRSAAAKLLGSPFEQGPVLEELTAENMIRNWAEVYSFMAAVGTGFDRWFSNYSLKEVLDSAVDASSTAENIVSAVVCTVSVPNSNKTYTLNYTNVFSYRNLYYFDYYASAINYCLCIDQSTSQQDYNILTSCLNSIDVTRFNNNYNK